VENKQTKNSPQLIIVTITGIKQTTISCYPNPISCFAHFESINQADF